MMDEGLLMLPNLGKVPFYVLSGISGTFADQ